MIELFSMEFWMVILFGIDFFLVIFLFVLVKKMNHLDLGQPLDPGADDENTDAERASRSAADIVGLLEPLVQESRTVAIRFDEQVKEKKRLVRELNDALDSRIISINLLLSRADALQKKLEEKQALSNHSFSLPKGVNIHPSSSGVVDQQNQIIEMYRQNLDMDTIAQRLSVPKGEVQLVIDLKKKFMAMEENSR